MPPSPDVCKEDPTLAPVPAGALQDLRQEEACFMLHLAVKVSGGDGELVQILLRAMEPLVPAGIDFASNASLAHGRSTDAEPRLHLSTGGHPAASNCSWRLLILVAKRSHRMLTESKGTPPRVRNPRSLRMFAT
jgi:hypothetical protein